MRFACWCDKRLGMAVPANFRPGACAFAPGSAFTAAPIASSSPLRVRAHGQQFSSAIDVLTRSTRRMLSLIVYGGPLD
jgi:hypothetical protein